MKTADGFQVDRPFCYLFIQAFNPGQSMCLLMYYRDQKAWKNGEMQIRLPELPTAFNADITADEFWGDKLATVYHKKAMAQIEQITGPGSCEIVK